MRTDLDRASPEQRFFQYARSGDKAIIQSLIKEFADRSYTQARRIIGRSDGAEDAVQDAYLRLVSTAHRYDGSVPFGAWLGRLVSAAAINYRQRRIGRHKNLGAMDARVASLNASNNDSQSTENLDPPEYDTLRAALDSLPERYRMPLTLHYFGGLDRNETAQALGISTVTVAKQLERGIEQLRAKLGRSGFAVTSAGLIALFLATPTYAAPPEFTAALSVTRRLLKARQAWLIKGSGAVPFAALAAVAISVTAVVSYRTKSASVPVARPDPVHIAELAPDHLAANGVSRAFIGAEGFGAEANGWRQSNAQILFVDNLNDDGPGSFRAAYSSANGPRYIIFRVGGYIPVRSDLVAANGNLYVAGQTAPGDGITLKGECIFPHYDGLYISGPHICVRYLRVRNHSGSENAWGIALHGASDSIVDHCSTSWATSVQLMMMTTAGRVTIQNTIGAECRAFMMTFYGDYPHGPCSAHHNFLVGGGQRNPLAQAGEPSEFNQNLVYNWGGHLGTACEIYDYGDSPRFDFLNNYFKWGPQTGWANAQPGWNDPALGYEFWANNPASPGTLFLSGNQALLPAESGGFVEARLLNQGEYALASSKRAAPAIPVTLRDIDTQARADAWAAQLLSHVGCSKPRRDAYDQFLIKAYSDFTGWDGCGASTTEYDSPFAIANGGNPWPSLENGTPLSLKPSGMTQEFIDRMGLANTVASALSASISRARGLGEDYQNIEWCLMEQAGDIQPLGKSQARH